MNINYSMNICFITIKKLQFVDIASFQTDFLFWLFVNWGGLIYCFSEPFQQLGF